MYMRRFMVQVKKQECGSHPELGPPFGKAGYVAAGADKVSLDAVARILN
jgi:hypothetical protein